MRLSEREREWIFKDYPGVPNDEIERFLWRCEQAGLNPLLGHARLQGRKNSKTGKTTYTMLVQRDGLRVVADQSEKLDGIKTVPNFEDGKLFSATAWVWRKDRSHPFETTVFLSEYQEGEYLWKSKPSTMLCKVAEVAALRMAFPSLGGMYSEEEMEGIDRETGEIIPPPKPLIRPPIKPPAPEETPPVDGEEKKAHALAQALHVRLSQEGVDEDVFVEVLQRVGLLPVMTDGSKPHLRKIGSKKIQDILSSFDSWKESVEELKREKEEKELQELENRR